MPFLSARRNGILISEKINGFLIFVMHNELMLTKNLPKIMLIEGDSQVAAQLHRHLRTTYLVDLSLSGSKALKKLESAPYALAVVGEHVQDMPSFVLCNKIHEEFPKLHLIAGVSTTDIHQKVALLDAGADDCLRLPFDITELKAKIRALLRRNPAANHQIFSCADLQLDTAKQQVIRGGQAITLRPKEFIILECLLRHLDQAVSRQTINDYAWNNNQASWNVSIDVHISLLRAKIDKPFPQKLIKTVYHTGYKITAK